MKLQTGSFLSICSDALALHDATLRDLATRHLKLVANASADVSAESASMLDDELPTPESCIVSQNVAVIPIHGVMVKRSQIWCGWFDYGVRIGSDHWAEVVSNLTQRADIDAIVFDFDTGGGQVAGTEKLADAIWKARQAGKLTIACVNEFCASAGLWAAAQCEHITIPATGSIGSLGVYTLHFDDTKWFTEMGIDKSVVYRGAYKAIDERALDADGKADMQRFIDAKYSLFVDAVARGRNLSPEEVTSRWGDSRLFSGSEAVSNGLADEIGTLQDVLASLQAGRHGRVSIEFVPADNEGEPEAMKLNAQGQVLDTAGKVVGNLSELQIDAVTLTKHFASQTGELIDSAVKTAKDAAEETLKAAVIEATKSANARLDELVAAVGFEKGVAAFKSGKSIEAAKAALADDLAAVLKEKDAEIAKLKESNATGGKAPSFIASDSAGTGAAAAPAADRSEFAADWDANKDNAQQEFRNEKEYAAYRRHKG